MSLPLSDLAAVGLRRSRSGCGFGASVSSSPDSDELRVSDLSGLSLFDSSAMSSNIRPRGRGRAVSGREEEEEEEVVGRSPNRMPIGAVDMMVGMTIGILKDSGKFPVYQEK